MLPWHLFPANGAKAIPEGFNCQLILAADSHRFTTPPNRANGHATTFPAIYGLIEWTSIRLLVSLDKSAVYRKNGLI
jgi:hypothetical protein